MYAIASRLDTRAPSGPPPLLTIDSRKVKLSAACYVRRDVLTLELTMWKPALFLITVVLVTPIGRSALRQYAHRASSLFAANSTYGDLAIVSMALVFLALLLLILCQSPKDPSTQWTLRRVEGQEPAGASSNRTQSKPLGADRHITGLAAWLPWFRHLTERLRRC